jgi:hypothetical protein
MTKRILNTVFILITFLAISSCLNEKLKTPKPAGLIDQNKMAEILADMQIAEAQVRIDGKYGDSLKIYTSVYYSEILKKHDVSLEKFNTSHHYYLLHPVEYEKISQKIIEILTKYEAENL